MRKLRYGVIAFLLVPVVAGYAYWQRSDTREKNGYVTEHVDRGLIDATVTATGTVNPVTTVQVGTYVSGPIQAIDVDFNSPVRRGQRVAKIDPRQFQVRVQRAEASLANAQAHVTKAHADLKLKQLTLDRTRDLFAQRLVSQNELDTAQSNYDQAVGQLALDTAGVKQAEAEVQDARIQLAYTDISSPVDGVVVSRNVDVGQTVAASFQTPTLFLIAEDLTKMQVNANVSESDIGAVRQGQPATFSVDAYPGREFTGTVVQVRNAPINVQNVVTYDVVIGVDNSGLELKPGMTATVTVITGRREDVVRVPVRALRFNPDGRATGTPAQSTNNATAATTVWRVEPDGTIRRVEIATGLRNDMYVEVISGEIESGDRIAVALKRTEPPAQQPRLPGFQPRMR